MLRPAAAPPLGLHWSGLDGIASTPSRLGIQPALSDSAGRCTSASRTPAGAEKGAACDRHQAAEVRRRRERRGEGGEESGGRRVHREAGSKRGWTSTRWTRTPLEAGGGGGRAVRREGPAGPPSLTPPPRPRRTSARRRRSPGGDPCTSCRSGSALRRTASRSTPRSSARRSWTSQFR